jgi:sec-independent protein translocase protein TatC
MALGILNRGGERGLAEPGLILPEGGPSPEEGRRMTVVEHLRELRRVLVVSMVAWVLATIVAAVFDRVILRILEFPLLHVLSQHNHLLSRPIITSPTELVTIPLEVAVVGGLVLSMPVIGWQAWTFVSPGLRPVERRFALPFVLSVVILFAAGAGLAYLLMPVWLNILTSIVGGNAVYFPDLSQYLSFLSLAVVAFGLTFELPVAIVILGLLRIVSSRGLRRRRKLVWLAIVLGAELVTPGVDPVTPLFLAIPLLLLYELAVVVLARALHR